MSALCWRRAFTIAGLGAFFLQASIAQEARISRAYPHHVDFSLVEKAGVERSSEPVLVDFPLPPGLSEPGDLLLWDRTRSGRISVQLESAEKPRQFRILLLASQPALSEISYRLHYGGRQQQAESETRLAVSGEPLAWKVENPCWILDFSRNPGTGRSGQLNKILLKDKNLWLTRDRDQSTLHLSPNAAGTEHYVPVNRWDPPEKWQIHEGLLSFRLQREGPMPKLPGLRGRVVYEVFAEGCGLAIQERIQALEDTALSLLRVGELTLAPDPGNPFTHLAWERDASDFVVQLRREDAPQLPLDVPWMAFINAPGSFALASVLESIRYSPADRPPTLLNPLARFSGQPAHYFFRTFIGTESGDPQRLVTVASGSVYLLRHWLYCLEGHDEPVQEMARRISRLAKSIRDPLQVQPR